MIPPTKCSIGTFDAKLVIFSDQNPQKQRLFYLILLICKLSFPYSHSHDAGFKIAAIFYANKAENVNAILISRPCDKKGYELYILCGGHSDPENSQRITFTRRGELPK